MKKEDVLRAYQEQKAACIVAFPTLTSSWTYFVQLEKAIDSYFSNADSVSDSVRAVIRGAYVSQTKAALKCKVEDRGKVVETPDKKSIVKKLYLNCGLLEQIQDNSLDVYVPSYLGGVGNA